jgi:hypothetical protein
MDYSHSFCEMNENYDHQHQNVRKENDIQYGDLAEFMDFEYMKKVACSNLLHSAIWLGLQKHHKRWN